VGRITEGRWTKGKRGMRRTEDGLVLGGRDVAKVVGSTREQERKRLSVRNRRSWAAGQSAKRGVKQKRAGAKIAR